MAAFRLKPGIAALLILTLFASAFAAQPPTRRQIREWTSLLNSDDGQKRSSAATSLLATDDEAALKALIAALAPDKSEAVRISVITAFGVKGDDRATGLIIDALGDRSEAIQQAASSALRSINTPEAIKQIEQAAASANRPVILRVQTLGILGDMRAMDSIPALIKLLQDPEEAVRSAAQSALTRITLRSFATGNDWETWWETSARLSREEMLEDLVTLQAERIKNLNRLVDKLYLSVLTERKDRTDPKPLIDALAETESVPVKLYAIKELIPLKSDVVVAALTRSLTDAASPVRKAAVEALGAMKAADAISVVAERLNDPSVEVCSAAVLSLAQLENPDAVPPLIGALKHPSASIRASVAQALGTLKNPAAVNALAGMLNDPSPEAAAAAAGALGNIGDPASVDGLIKIVTSGKAAPVVYESAAGALAKMKDPRAIPALLEMLKSDKEKIRWAAVDALGAMKARDAIAPLSPVALKDTNPQIREAALASLSKIGDPAAWETMAAALGDPEKRICDQAMRSLLQLAETDASLYGSAIDRLLTGKLYDAGEAVLAGAVERYSRTPNNSVEVQALRYRLATGLMNAKEYPRARPYLEKLIAGAPKDNGYMKDLAACLAALGDQSARLAVCAQARAATAAEAPYWWQQSMNAVEALAAKENHADVVSAVDALEKENAEMGGESVSKRLKELRLKSQQRLAAILPAPRE